MKSFKKQLTRVLKNKTIIGLKWIGIYDSGNLNGTT